MIPQAPVLVQHQGGWNTLNSPLYTHTHRKDTLTQPACDMTML